MMRFVIRKRAAFVMFFVVGVVALLMYLLGAEGRERRAILLELVSTNASLDAVETEVGPFTLTRRSDPQWEQLLKRFKSGSKWEQKIGVKMEQAVVIGHTSTVWMQTWIFLDEKERLIGFELGTQ